jgi:hypothetical protein
VFGGNPIADIFITFFDLFINDATINEVYNFLNFLLKKSIYIIKSQFILFSFQ